MFAKIEPSSEIALVVEKDATPVVEYKAIPGVGAVETISIVKCYAVPVVECQAIDRMDRENTGIEVEKKFPSQIELVDMKTKASSIPPVTVDQYLLSLEKFTIVPSKTSSLLLALLSLVDLIELISQYVPLPYATEVGSTLKTVKDYVVESGVCEMISPVTKKFRAESTSSTDKFEIVDPRPRMHRVCQSRTNDYDFVFNGKPVYHIRGHHGYEGKPEPLTGGYKEVNCCIACCLTRNPFEYKHEFKVGTFAARKHSVMNPSGAVVGIIPHNRIYYAEQDHCCNEGPCVAIACSDICAIFSTPWCCSKEIINCNCCAPLCYPTYLGSAPTESVRCWFPKDTRVATAILGEGPSRSMYINYRNSIRGHVCSCPPAEHIELPGVNFPNTVTIGRPAMCCAKSNRGCVSECWSDAQLRPFIVTPFDNRMEVNGMGCLKWIYHHLDIMTLIEQYFPVGAVTNVVSAVVGAGVLDIATTVYDNASAVNDAVSEVQDQQDGEKVVKDNDGVCARCCAPVFKDINANVDITFPTEYTLEQRLLAIAAGIVVSQGPAIGKYNKAM